MTDEERAEMWNGIEKLKKERAAVEKSKEYKKQGYSAETAERLGFYEIYGKKELFEQTKKEADAKKLGKALKKAKAETDPFLKNW